jgi:hypothetical protein
MVTKATVARQHVRNALLDRVVMAVPFHVAGADRHHRTPRCVPIGLAGWNIEAKCRRQGGDRGHQSNDSFHRDSPDAWRTALLVEGIIGALRQINHSQKRAACGLLLARIRPEQTTVIAATTETPRGERSHAVGAHVAEGQGGRLVHLGGSGTSTPISSHIKLGETNYFEDAFLLARLFL